MFTSKRMLTMLVCGIFLNKCLTAQVPEKPNMHLAGVQKDPAVTLDITKGNYSLRGEYIVPKGCELIIKEGVRVLADKKAKLIVQGRLDIQGTKEKPVVIKGASSGVGVWDGIQIMQTSSEMSHVHISGAKEAVLCEQSDLRIWNSTFYRNETAMRTHEGRSAQLENCYFSENKRVFDSHGCKLELDYCSFVKSKEAVMSGSWGGETICRDCLIQDNRAGFRGYSSIEMHGCAIQRNGKFDINNEATSPGNCTENWWGKQNTGLLNRNGAAKLPTILGTACNIADFLKEMPEGCGAHDFPKETLK